MARQSHIRFTIPEPCSVPWKGMTPVDTDQRYCSSCEKVITDFSKMSDDELMLYFRHSGGNVCGKYSKTQLNRPFLLLPEKTSKANWWKTFLLLPLALFGKQLKAQYYEAVHSLTSPDTARVTGETALKKDSAVTAVEDPIASNSNDSIKKDSLLVITTPPPPDTSRMLYVWNPSTCFSDLSNVYILNPEMMTSGCMVMIVEPDYKIPSFINILNPKPIAPPASWLHTDKAQKEAPEKNLTAQNPYRELTGKQEEKPKPQQPALPASTDISALLPKEDRRYKRS